MGPLAGEVIGPRDNVFPGPAVALDGPGLGCRTCDREIASSIPGRCIAR